MDPLEMFLNPEDSKMLVSYVYFMPYDWVKWQLGNHFGDLERTEITFENGVPGNVRAHKHASYHDRDFSKVEHHQTHPVVYNAKGTHATYFNHGRILRPELDVTCRAGLWDFWLDMDVVFPWNWLDDKYIIKTDDPVLNGTSYLTQVGDWGNKDMGISLFGEAQLTGGPSGYLGKFDDFMLDLESLGYVCEGLDNDRCLWPAGSWSKAQGLCEDGFTFSYLTEKCYKQQPWGKVKCKETWQSESPLS